MRRDLATIYLTVLIDLMGFGIVIPLLPLYGERYHPSPVAFGLLMAAYSALQFVFAPVLGRLSDRIGRKPVLIVSLLGSVAGYLVFAFARSLPALLISRVIDGASGGNISTAQAYVADVTTEDERTHAMGGIGAAFGVGFILGPAIAGLTLPLGESAPGLAAAGLSLIAAVTAALFLREPARHLATRGSRWRAVTRTLSARRIAAILGVFFLLTLAFSNFEATFAQFLHDRLTIAATRVAFVFVYIGVLIAAVQGGLLRALARRFSDRRLAVGGVALAAAGLALLPLSASPPMAMAFLLPLCVGIGVANPSLSSWISKESPAGERGMVLGAYQSASSLARILGPMWGELIYFRAGPAGPHWSGAALAGAAVLLALWKTGKP